MTKVRLISSGPFPQHEESMEGFPAEDYARQFGRVVLIGIPVKPTPNWKCNTDVVWPLLEHKMKDGIYPHVCRHMIEAGD